MYSARVVVHDGKDILDVLEIDRDVRDEVEMVKAARAFTAMHMKFHHPDVAQYQVTYENIHRR